MSDPRCHYVIERSAYLAADDLHAVVLPDAEHIHVTRHPDGTLTATPMVLLGWKWPSDDTTAWVDRPTGGDQ